MPLTGAVTTFRITEMSISTSTDPVTGVRPTGLATVGDPVTGPVTDRAIALAARPVHARPTGPAPCPADPTDLVSAPGGPPSGLPPDRRNGPPNDLPPDRHNGLHVPQPAIFNRAGMPASTVIAVRRADNGPKPLPVLHPASGPAPPSVPRGLLPDLHNVHTETLLAAVAVVPRPVLTVTAAQPAGVEGGDGDRI